jgi:UDP-glucose 4-epimerase
MITAYEKASGKKIPYEIRDRRAGDMEACWADVTLADRLLNWRAKRGVQEMCNDDWSWRRNLINKFLNK